MPLKPTDAVFESLVRFADDVKRTHELAQSSNAQPEDQLKPVVKQLVEQIGQAVRMDIAAVSETRLDEIGRPDFGVLDRQLLVGFIELKAPDVDILRLRGRDALQLKRFRAIPNLIYTNGSDWAFYRRAASDDESQLLSEFTVKIDSMLEVGGKAVSRDHARDLLGMFREFLHWKPIVPSTAKGLAEQLAPLTRLLRDEVITAVNNPEGRALKSVHDDWKRTLFPEASVAEFADSYAQTVTYGLLLARISGSHVLSMNEAARAIASRSGLLARTLELLTQQGTQDELGVAIDLLERTIDAVSASALAASDENTDPWLYFYEDFLSVYDPDLRNRRGVYYTPAQVVQAQVRLVDDVLRSHLGRPDGIAADDVTILDPALGTGTYLLTALQYGAEKGAERWGPGAKGSTATKMAENLFGFELLVGPYAVAHVRLTQLLHELGGQEPDEGMNVYLTDTLESPNEITTLPHSYFEEPLAEERRRAREVKAKQRILVTIGNPPYEREISEVEEKSSGGWIRYGDKGKPGSGGGILDDFIAPARSAGAGLHIKNLYNLYVYFWRWAIWKTVESQGDSGVVSFITASSFLTGPGFIGMREHMRKSFDHIWIIDLGGESRGTRTSENVFDIRTPVCIAIGIRQAAGARPANTHGLVSYTEVAGTRAEKLNVLESLTGLSDLEWADVTFEQGPGGSFLPDYQGDFRTYPRIDHLFPWTHSGVELKRSWPIAFLEDLLLTRWRSLAGSERRGELFRETRDRKIGREYPDQLGELGPLKPIQELTLEDPAPPIEDYGFRTFDLQKVFRDTRVGDFYRPPLWKSISSRQIFLATLMNEPLGTGTAIAAFHAVPDRNAFNNRSGMSIPLYRDAATTQPNITAGLLDHLQAVLDITITPEDLMAYVAGIMGSPAYTSTFEEELATPGPRIPITKDSDLFQRVAEVGKQVIAWQTYARRFPEAIGTSNGYVPQGSANVQVGIPETPEAYPESLNDVVYDENARELKVGDGVIENVAPEVFNYEVSGFRVVRSWLGYRVKNRSGKKSSPLDDIRPEHWTWEMTEGLLELLWAVEGVVNLEPMQAELLADVLAEDVFLEDELPTPTDAERKPPSGKDSAIQPPLL